MLRIAICDDEKAACAQLEDILEEIAKTISEEFEVEVFFSGEKLCEFLSRDSHFDILFLDIELDIMNGIEVGKKIRDEMFNEITQIVYISSKENYAIQLFKIRPLDFVIKPLTYEKIADVTLTALRLIQKGNNFFNYQIGYTTYKVPINEILYFESKNRKINIITIESINSFYGTLDSVYDKVKQFDFINIHKSINLSLFDSNSNYSSIVGIIIVKIISYIVVLIIENFKNIKNGINISNAYWFSVFLTPLGTLYISLLLFQNGSLNVLQILTCITILLLINILTFYLYDAINKAFENKVESILMKQQNMYYHRQFEIMDNSYKSVKSVRHDIKNHLFSLKNYIDNDEKIKALGYIEQIINSSYDKKEFAHSGNVDIDSILNYKLQKATEKEIEVSLELKVPHDLKFSTFDIIIVLGNLLDNAINATVKLKEVKKINVCIRYKKNMLFIHVDNSFDGYVAYEFNKIITSNNDKENHGMGLNNIKNVISKYNGTIEIHHTENNFGVDILMYVI